MALGAFRVSAGAQAERSRRRRILLAHPEIRQLFGPARSSAILVVLLVAAHLTLAAALSAVSLWIVAAAVVCPGALLAANLTAMIHEAQHGLIFRGPKANRAIALVANLGLVTPSAMAFFHYHGWHHAAMGDYEMDVGIPTQAEARWVGDSAWRKALWLAAFPVFQGLRTAKFRGREPFWTGWMIANTAIQIAAGIGVLDFWGPRALAYLALSYALSIGFHPLGTRVIQEHFVVAEGQETGNYVGWASLLECNFGHHAEHHDFPRIAWSRLPRVSRMAPEFYRDTPVFRSRIALMVSFILDRRWHLYRHAVRASSS
ncbi:MAG TPA: fatty acid desaturase [Phenylobacterium sp.]|jgi:sphingolipid delta-4 desaturase|uniref:fatty acid desaturase n=1 Tax=Phenylobacterium sp. TaxID=1871053 RepID=UPI002D129831|nr:fatty acid desaturase [Phenylobacterium sp.]HXA37971.1 fatty acid desaturase [Phenylobacterium sp.]